MKAEEVPHLLWYHVASRIEERYEIEDFTKKDYAFIHSAIEKYLKNKKKRKRIVSVAEFKDRSFGFYIKYRNKTVWFVYRTKDQKLITVLNPKQVRMSRRLLAIKPA